jgi:hypothetical protein
MHGKDRYVQVSRVYLAMKALLVYPFMRALPTDANNVLLLRRLRP